MDREKVIKGLECCTRYEVGKRLNNCLDCPYIEPIGFNQFRCKSQDMKEDALALLKEQDAEIEQLNRFVNGFSRDAMPVVRCKDCRYGQYCTDGETTYQCFKWNSGEFGVLHEQDWFCADGEKGGQ